MEERYEIRGKIGQGGLGAVYKGYDTRMNREVAIKRISVSNEDPTLQEESTRQLLKEAGALASLQHPHIVTVYDVGADADGPYVVMELINGKTLDELIEQAPLTWSDFRELAIQTQEALIAAQELDLIHSDIKPSNLMLTWLPSGKFQLKIVDFGLATLTQSQTREELEELEAVFGSIFFMAPEQFERVPLDARVDVYAMGCVYYQALTGTYPFRGETGNEVMTSHLHHTVIPLQEIRSEIPLWACDWIMWQINRMPADRPANARECLHIFLQNDKNPTPTLSLGKATPPPPTAPKARPAGQTPTPKGPTRKIIDPRLAPPGYVQPPESEPEPIPPPPLTTTVPKPLLPPEGSKPSIHTALLIPEPTPTVTPSASVPLRPTGKIQGAPSRRVITSKKSSFNGITVAVAAALCVLLVLVSYKLYLHIKESKGSQRYGEILQMAAKSDVTEIPMTGSEFAHFIDVASNADTDSKREYSIRALAIAKASDSSDFDATLLENVLKKNELFLPEDRAKMILNAIGPRVKAPMVNQLLDYARSTNDFGSAAAAIKAIGATADDSHFATLLNMVIYDDHANIRTAAEESAAEIIKRSKNKAGLISQVDKSIEETNNSKVRQALKQMKGGS